MRDVWTLRFVAPRPIVLPLLWGEGWGEGERGRRTDVAAQNVFGTREIEPQFLAALHSVLRISEFPNAPGESGPAAPEDGLTPPQAGLGSGGTCRTFPSLLIPLVFLVKSDGLGYMTIL